MGWPGVEPKEARRFVRAYQQAKSDGDAAEALGVSTSEFRRWRVAFGLPDKDRFRPERIPAIAFWVAYEDHRSDLRSAEELGVPEAAFCKWRAGAGLPQKGVRAGDGPGGPGGPRAGGRRGATETRRTRIPDPAWQEAYDTTATDGEMAAVVGATAGGAAAWRHRHGLPGASRRAFEALPGFHHRTWFAAWQEAGDDHDAAARLDVRVGTFRRWRRAWGLSARK